MKCSAPVKPVLNRGFGSGWGARRLRPPGQDRVGNTTGRRPLLLERTGTTPVGYLHLRSFIGTANDALDDAMAVFRAGVEGLIIDFRYNGGGRLDVADHMLDLLAGTLPSAIGQESWRLANDSAVKGLARPAATEQHPPPAHRVHHYQGTASASELVINSLSPHIEVVLVGENTLGKAVGQYALSISVPGMGVL